MRIINGNRAFADGEFKIALALYEAKAAEGDIEACAMAGYMLSFGPALFGAGVPCDRRRARRWLRTAAEQNHMVAQMLVRQIDRLDGLSPAEERFNSDTILDAEVEC